MFFEYPLSLGFLSGRQVFEGALCICFCSRLFLSGGLKMASALGFCCIRCGQSQGQGKKAFM
jgi:hypothetical protein